MEPICIKDKWWNLFAWLASQLQALPQPLQWTNRPPPWVRWWLYIWWWPRTLNDGQLYRSLLKVGFHWSRKWVMIWSSCDGAEEFEGNAGIAAVVGWTHFKTSHFHLIFHHLAFIPISNFLTCLVFPLSLEPFPLLPLRLRRKVCPSSTFPSVPTIMILSLHKFASLLPQWLHWHT